MEKNDSLNVGVRLLIDIGQHANASGWHSKASLDHHLQVIGNLLKRHVVHIDAMNPDFLDIFPVLTNMIGPAKVLVEFVLVLEWWKGLRFGGDLWLPKLRVSHNRCRVVSPHRGSATPPA